jgi:glutathione S-transferase
MATLYHHPYSQHARRVVSLLEAASLPYELHRVALEKGEHRSPEFLVLNPNHQIPVFIDGEIVLFESHAICRYLCAKHKLTQWYPTELATRARIDQWLDWNQCRLFPTVRDIVLNKVFLGQNGDAAAIARGEAALPELMNILEAGLADREFLAGDGPTLADLSVASNIFQLGLAQVVPDSPNLSRWYQHVGQIEGFRKSLPPTTMA